MQALTVFILLISVVASVAAYLQGERESVVAYWREKLPTTPIPQSVWELISGNDEKEAVNERFGGVLSLIRLVQEIESVAKHEKMDSLSRGVPDELPSNPGSYAVDDQLFNYHGYISLFLLEKNLQCGTKISVNFSNKQKMHLLPRVVADEIPFSSEKLSVALKELNISPDSLTALAMKRALKACERPAVAGETKYCATSLESMIDITASKLESNRLTVLATNVPKMSRSMKQEYTIVGVKFESEAEKPMTVCHLVRYAYAVYYCHELHGTKAARVWVKGEDGKTMEAAAICHTDTSAWSPEHAALQKFKLKPGGASVCHFTIENHLVWVGAN